MEIAGSYLNPNIAYFSRYSTEPTSVQKKIGESSVMVLGCGGVGILATQALASMGVGRIVLVDCDVVSESNLNRQFLYSPKDVGVSKVLVASREINDKYPGVCVETVEKYISSDKDLKELLDEFHADILICAIDRPVGVASYVEEYVNSRGIPVVSAGVGIRYGHVSLALPNKSHVNKEEKQIGRWKDRSKNKILSGSLATTNGMIGLTVAHIVQMWLTGSAALPTEQFSLWHFDFEDITLGLDI